ncbi:MAG: hypothetical protein JOY64_19600 [Alphaproteobacteria bacterium]|nr:hypothetical protein [Alphaproteobacteria bacterium]MBV8409843.1 hypothetical protein [Alphaproteobacteria bacterium]
MASPSMSRSSLGVCIALLAVACADAKSTPGTDPETGTTASVITWSDGARAFSIDCQLPGDCRNRAFALCHGGQYTTLKADTITPADYTRGISGRATMVARCT